MKSGSIFDNILICDDEEYATNFGDETWGETKGPEKEMKDAVSRIKLPRNPGQCLGLPSTVFCESG